MNCGGWLYLNEEKLTSITIPDGVTGIGDYAFFGCAGLTSVTIPSSVTNLGEYVFYGCEDLRNVYFEEVAGWSVAKYWYSEKEPLSPHVISGSYSSAIHLTSTYVNYLWERDPSVVGGVCGTELAWLLTEDGTLTVSGSGDMNTYTFSEENGSSAPWYSYRESIRSVIINVGVNSIGEYAFYNCPNLTSVELWFTVNKIGRYAFASCDNLKNVQFDIVDKWLVSQTSSSENETEILGNLLSDPSTAAECLTSTYKDQYWSRDFATIASGECGGALTWNLTDDGVLSILGSGVMTNYQANSAPWASYSGMIENVFISDGVTGIGDYAFYNCGALKKIYIGNNVKTIGDRAFGYCDSLISIDLPNSLKKIGDYAFSECGSLVNIELPEKLESIGDYAFKSTGLTSIIVPDSVTSFGDGVFSYCYNLKIATLGDGLSAISDNTFYNCTALISVNIGYNILFETPKSIGDSAFEGCRSLVSITLPKSLEYIGNKAFAGCYKLVEVINRSSLEIEAGKNYYGQVAEYALYVHNSDNIYIREENGWLFCYNGQDSEYILLGHKEGDTATELVLPDNFRGRAYSIYKYAFYGYKNLSSVTIGNKVTSIGDYAFYSCTGLMSVTIPESVTSIGYQAFYGCYKLFEVNNHSILDITAGSFDNGYIAYYAIEVHKGESKIVDKNGFLFYTYNGVNYLIGYTGTETELVLPNNYNGENYKIHNYAFRLCSGITSVTIPDSVTSIGAYAFYSCSGLTSVTIPDSVTSIGAYAFYSCSGLTSVTIPDSVTSIGSNAFYYCSGITSVTIGNGVTSIGSNAFKGTDYYKDANNWEGDVLYIGNYLITTKTSISGEYTIKSGTRVIASNAFNSCNSLTSVDIPDSVTSIGAYAFSECSGLTSVTIGNSVTSIGDYAFYRCKNLTSVEIPDSVTSIGAYAFYYCSGITSVTIGSSVTSIGAYAFYSCSGITSVTIPASVKSIGDAAFYNCSGLISAVFECPEKWWMNYNWVNDSNDSLYDPITAAKSLKNSQVYWFHDLSLEAGACGNNIGWILTSDGTLTISGRGYFHTNSASTAPWYPFRDRIFKVIIEGDIEHIGSYAFYNCTALVSVVISDSVTTIDDYAFEGCSSLMSIVIGDSVTNIGDSAFKGCSSLMSIVIGDSVTNIGDSAFEGCSSLTSIVIGDSVTNIGEAAFRYCTALTNVEMGKSVETIGRFAFYSCDALTSVFFKSCNGWKAVWSFSPLNRINLEEVSLKNAFTAATYLRSTYVNSYWDHAELYDYCGSDVYWRLSDDGVLSIHGIGEMYDYDFAEQVPWYLYRSSITEIAIDRGVKKIGAFAFYGCDSLTRITIPDSVTEIGSRAFYSCDKLLSVVVGKNVETIGEYAFYFCESIVEVINKANFNIKEGSEEYGYIGYYANEVHSGESKIVEKDGYIFYLYYDKIYLMGYTGEDLVDELILPDSYNGKEYEIYTNAFYACDNLRRITIGSGVTKIAQNAFKSCSKLVEIINRSSLEIKNSDIINSAVFEVHTEPSRIVDENGWLFYTYDGVNYLLGYKYARTVAELILPESYKGESYQIHRYAFSGCDNIIRIELSSGVIGIGREAFELCRGLTSVIIPNSVTSIGDYAFHACYSLIKIELPDTEIGIGTSAFYNTGYYKDASNWDNGVLYIGKHLIMADEGSVSGSYTVKEGTKFIANNAFSKCSKLKSIVFPDSLINIGNYAFERCSGLTSISFGDGALTIGDYAFNYLSRLTSISFGDGALTIGKYAFEYCRGLTSISFGDGALTIGNYAFENCSGLTSISFGDGALTIDGYAFRYCSGLTSISFGGGALTIDGYAFSYCSGLTSISFGGGALTIDGYAFSYCSGLTSVTIGNNATIKAYAFSDCTNLKTLILGNEANDLSETTVASRAFSYCKLKTVIIGKGVKTISNNAFGFSSDATVNVHCSWSIKYDFPNNVTITRAAHIWIPATCEAPKTCTECGKIEGDPMHSWVSATCEAPKTCTVCGKTEGDPVHSWVSATCEAPKTCTVCGRTEGEPVHSWSPATCVDAKTCILCGKTDGEPLGHVYADATCETPKTCTRCGITNGEPLGHVYADATCEIAKVCTRCGGTDGEPLGHSWSVATCVTPQTCTVCNVTTGGVDWNNHTYNTSHCGKESETVFWEFNEDTRTITISGTGKMNDYSSPTDTPWSQLSDRIKRVVIESGVTTVGDFAFAYCTDLTRASLGYVVSVGNSAFEACVKLEVISIPYYVVSIGEYAFSGCCSAESVTMPDRVSSIGKYAFNGCSSLESITIPNRVTSIKESTFSGCSSLITITISNNVSSIGKYAFNGCSSLKSVTIPYRVTSIEESTFSGCSSLESITIPNMVTSIGSLAFYGCTNITTVNLGARITSIGTAAFDSCPRLATVNAQCGWSEGIYDFPTTVEVKILPHEWVLGQCEVKHCSACGATGGEAKHTWEFQGCELPSICGVCGAIDNNVVEHQWLTYNCEYDVCSVCGTRNYNIEIRHFWVSATCEYAKRCYECGKTEGEPLGHSWLAATCTKPKTCESCGKTEGEIDSSNHTYNTSHCGKVTETVFWVYDQNLKTLTISGSGDMTDYYRSTETPWYKIRENIKNITIELGVTSIGENAFGYCTKLESVNIPDSVTVIGKNAFFDCYKLKEIVFPTGLTCINDSAFYNCTYLEAVTIPNTVTAIGVRAFSGCDRLSELTLPASVMHIGENAFYGCYRLDTVNAPCNWDGTLYTFPDGVRVKKAAHKWEAPSCYEVKTCIYCGAVNDYIGHIWVAATCEHPEFCGICYITNGEPLEHYWKEADCYSPKTCLICSKVVGEALGHSWVDASCEKPKSCAMCGLTEGEPLGHSWIDATCEAPKTCALCGLTEGEPLGHTWDTLDCEADKNCINCGALQVGEDHAWIAATCDTPATCRKCGATSGEPIDHFAGSDYICVYCGKEIESISGSCGDVGDGSSVTWTLNVKTEVLEISGTGKIKDHTSGGSATWKKHYSKIKAVIVNDGVTGIGDYAFAGCYELTSVLIGNGVTEIGEYAFENLRKLSSVTIGENVNIINDNAFSGCSTLQSLILPDTLTVIGNNAFYSCSALQSLILPDSVTVIGNNAFSDCRGLTELWLGDSVTGIGEAAFADCDQLLSVIIPDSVTIIGESAFYGCDELGIVVIGCGVESIGSCAFMECYNLKNVYLDSTSGWIAGNHAYDTEGFAIPEDEIASPKAVALCLREAEKYSYYYWVRHVHRYTEKVYPPTCFTEGVTEYICVCGDVYYGDRIPPDANAHVYSEMWRIPPECNVEGTVAYTCNECGYEYFETLPPTGIHEYRFSEVVEPTCGQKGYTLYICYRCLEGYADNWTEPTGKHDYTIPVIIEPTCTEKGYTSYTCQYCGAEGARDTWTEPAGHSFNGSLYCEKCGEFSSVAYGFCGAAGNEKAVTWTLDVDKSLLTISGNGEMADYSFESPWYAYSAYVDYVIIENGVENIGKNAFVDQYSLISVEIPDSVTRIEYGAFRNCCSLMNVSLGNGLTEIGGSAFEDCYSLVSITLPESLEAIGYSAFFGCSGLSSVTFAVTSDWHVRETASSQDIVDISETALAVPETAAAYLKGQYLAKYWFRAHIHSYTTVVSAPTCTAAGYTEYTCTSCGYGYIESGAEALGHVMVIDMNNTTFHDCTVGGIFTYACERECGYTEKTTVENGEHIFVSDTGVSEWTVISEATCTAHGYRTRPCLNEYCTADNYSYDPTDPDCIIPMLDHRFDGVCTVEPTYEADGYTYQLCELCGYREIIELIPALSLGTNGLKYEETENGYRIVGYTGTETDIEIPASYKGKPIVGVDPDLFARNALGITSVTISADTSSWDDAAFAECTLERVIVAQNVTYIPRGIFEAAVINVFCYEGAENALTVEDHVLGALEVGEWIFNYKEAHEHEYYAAVTQPDCTAEGAITYVCECGISYVKAAIPALGHSYIASVTYQTCYEEGFAIYTCERCGYEYSEVIEKTPEHVYSNGCDVDCDNCGNIRNAGEHVYDSDSDTECNECGAVREASKIIDSGTCGDAVIWKLTESGVLIISGSGAMDDFSATNVNYMAPWKDYKTTVTKVIIENGVTNIGRQAFNGYTNITEITISEDVTVIGRHCFQNCSNLMSLIIPDSVTKIELSAFSGCTKLSSVIIGKNVSIMEKQVFSNCKALKEIVIPMSVSLIGSMAFSNTGLTSVIFEDASGWWYASSETATSGKTFTSEDLSDPKTATTYLKSRYYSNFWHHTPEHSYVAVITAPTCSEQGYTTYICSDCGNSYVGNYAEPTGKHIYTITVTEPTCVLSGYTKRECSSCGAAYTDNNVNAVGHNYVYTVVESTCVSEGYTLYTCSGCGDFDFTLNTELNKHRYEDVVTAATCIENGYTTYTCADCGNSYIGDVIKAIGHVYDNEYDADCNNCGEVREVEIPVTVIAEGKCGATVNWKLRDDGTLVIYGKGSMNDLETVTDQPWGAYKSQITKVIIEEGIVSIGRSSFYGYNGITEVVLPDSLMAIEEYAFYQCTGLSGEFTIPAKVFYIGGYAFRRAGFTTLTFENPENWTFVNGVALDPTNAAKQFKSGSNFSKICTRTFEESAGNVIGGGELNGLVWTFSDTGVLTVGGEGDIPRFGVSNAPWFAYHGAVKNIVIEGNVTAIGRCAFYAYKVLTAVEINAPVTRIGDYSFYNCSNLKSINVPASVVEIDVYAFRKSGLTTATFEIPYGWSAGDTKIPMAELAGEGAADSLKLAYFAKKMTRDVNAEPEIIDPNYLTHGMLNSRTKWTLYWTDDTQTKLKLVISGKGDMPDFGTGEAPWYVNEEYRNNIVEIVVEDGVTDIGRCAFYGLRYVTKVILNEGLVTIGEFAFNKCRGITEITIPTTVTTIGANAFGGTGLAEIPTV